MTDKMKNIITVITIFAAITFIAIGVYRNENAVVFGKAVRICLECIGIG